MKQACAIRQQNCLMDFMLWFVVDYDIKWHQHLNNDQPLSKEQLFITKYHSIASIQFAIEWISTNHPDPPEVMAKRITNLRKINMSDTLFGEDYHVYDVPE